MNSAKQRYPCNKYTVYHLSVIIVNSSIAATKLLVVLKLRHQDTKIRKYHYAVNKILLITVKKRC